MVKADLEMECPECGCKSINFIKEHGILECENNHAWRTLPDPLPNFSSQISDKYFPGIIDEDFIKKALQTTIDLDNKEGVMTKISPCPICDGPRYVKRVFGGLRVIDVCGHCERVMEPHNYYFKKAFLEFIEELKTKPDDEK